MKFEEAIKECTIGKKITPTSDFDDWTVWMDNEENFMTDATDAPNGYFTLDNRMLEIDWKVVDDWGLTRYKYNKDVANPPLTIMHSNINVKKLKNILANDFSTKDKWNYASILKILHKRFGDLE